MEAQKKQKWMTDDLLTLVNKINDLYKEWKSTNDIVEYNQTLKCSIK